ncbi:hypothetical protein HN873_021293, partial [Arachis hypogaea]
RPLEQQQQPYEELTAQQSEQEAPVDAQAIGSVQAIAKASKVQILENRDLSAEKAEMISRFLRDPKFYSSPKIT